MGGGRWKVGRWIGGWLVGRRTHKAFVACVLSSCYPWQVNIEESPIRANTSSVLGCAPLYFHLSILPRSFTRIGCACHLPGLIYCRIFTRIIVIFCPLIVNVIVEILVQVYLFIFILLVCFFSLLQWTTLHRKN